MAFVSEPMREQPVRSRAKPERLVLSLFGLTDTTPNALGIWNAMRDLRRTTHGRNRALRQLTPESWGVCVA